MFTIIIIAAKAARKFSSVAAAAAALLAAGWSGTVQAETLASWELTSNASTTPIQEAETKALAISTAILTKGDGVIATATAGFGGKDYEEGTDLASALSSNNFLQITLTIAQCYTVSLQSIEYTLYRSKDTGPTFFQWVCFTNEIECAPIDVPENFTANASNKRFTTDLSSLPIFPPNTVVALRLAAWEATKDTGTFLLRADNSKTDIVISGTSEREVSDELTLDPISDGAVNCGEEPFVARLGIFGDSGTGVTTNVTTSAAITGTTTLVDGVFTYAPTKADAALSPITFTATVTKDGESPVSQFFDVTVNVIPPAIGEITTQQCYAGDTNIVALTLSGDYAEAGEIVSTNAICQTYGVTGQFSTNITDGVFWYAPSMEDIAIAEENEGVIGFKVVLTVGDLAATNEFTVAVSEKPDFFEGFEKIKTSTTYINTENTIFEGDAASWRGTNYLVNGRATDNFRGTRAVCFRESGTAYIEMSTSKANGAGTVSFWHGRVPNDTTQTTNLLEVLISNNGGSTWNSLTEDAIVVSNEFVKTTIDDVNVGGNVMLRFEKTYGNKRMYIDDIIITDYEGQAEIEPAIGEIADQTIRADESVEIRIMFYGDNGLTKSVECTTSGVASEEYGFDAATGDFSFAPSLADLALNDGVIEFTAYLKEGDNVRVSRSFTVTLLQPLPKWLELRPNGYIKENFNGMGSGKNAELPPPWRVAHTNELECFRGLSYLLAEGATNATTQIFKLGASLSTGGIYNIGASDDAEDRAVGFLSASSSSSKFRTCSLIVPLKNVSSAAISGFSVSFTWEKWRIGNAKKLDLCYSLGAPDWSWTKIDGFHMGYDAEEGSAARLENDDGSATWVSSIEEVVSKRKKGTVDVAIPAGGIIYLGWFYSANSNNSGNTQCWAVDDVRISAGNPDMTVIMMK